MYRQENKRSIERKKQKEQKTLVTSQKKEITQKKWEIMWLYTEFERKGSFRGRKKENRINESIMLKGRSDCEKSWKRKKGTETERKRERETWRVI